MKQKTVLYCVLNWGLGHATRSIPVIRALLDRGDRVIIASTDRSLALLRGEFPDCRFVDLPDYNIRYSRTRTGLVPGLLLQVPGIFRRLRQEQAAVETLVDRFKPDAVVSDNRYGCYSTRVPSHFMTHQLRFQVPAGLKRAAAVSEIFNRFCFQRYRSVWVPDDAGSPNLSGDLSHACRLAGHPKIHYIGPLTSLGTGRPVRSPGAEGPDFLFLISGPEPQRTVFERIVLERIGEVKGRKVVVLGKPEAEATGFQENTGDTVIHPHLKRAALIPLMRRARLVVCRSGYSTLMELAALGKAAVLVPTPGQTEQEYLGRHAARSGFFHCVPQKDFDLREAVSEAERLQRGNRMLPRFNRTDEIIRLLDG
ncbi:MAG: glycosyltransferase family protein [bacterium]|nr:glycosyltransferase family protein [bacterium]